MGERKRRLAAGVPPTPRFDARQVGAAFAALQSGDRAAAEAAFDRIQGGIPDDPDALHACGVLALHLDRPARAEELLARSVERNGADPASRAHLAIAYRRLGKPELAIEQLETALRIDPGIAEAHSNLGNLRLERGDVDDAMRSYERALALRPNYPEALNGLGDAQLASGMYERACANLELALHVDPSFHEARYNLSRARALWAASVEGDSVAPSPEAVPHAELALEAILGALESDPDNPAYLRQLESCVGRFDLRDPVEPRVRATLLRALVHPAVDPARLARPVVSLIATRHEAVALRAAAAMDRDLDGRELLELAAPLRALFDEPLAQRLLEETVVPNAFIQRLCVLARRAALEEWRAAPQHEPSMPLAALQALAHQAFNTEYVNDASEGELAVVDALRQAIDAERAAGRALPLHWMALYACYRALSTLEGAQDIAMDLARTPLAGLAKRQIEDLWTERELRSTIPALTGVADAVSASVRDQYEANPYPRWMRVREERPVASLAADLRHRFPHARLQRVVEQPAEILVAGCGTGRHPIATARRFPDARVLAVDLSLTSLAYALRKTRELGIANVEYQQADLLAMGSLPARFDVIECVGVLHHLADPLGGGRTLATLLRPGGVMRVGLYSALARRHVVRARELAAAEGFPATPDGIRALRRAVLRRSEDPLLSRLTRGEDFYSLSGLRDLVFHVQEHRLALPEIARMITELGLEFVGFELPDGAVAAAYSASFPGDPSRSSFENWQRFEERRPDTFAAMYQFWLRKPA